MTGESIQGRKVAFLLTDGFEQVELTEPWKAVQEAGGTPVLVSPKPDTVQGLDHIDKADTFDVDVQVADANAADYDALVLPGGVVNADDIRVDADSVAFAKAFFAAGKPVASICHAA
jgi:protease I